MADKKLRFALMNKFKKKLQESGKSQDINLFSQQWAADAMIDSYGYDQCLEAIEYYFSISASPDWTWFAYNSEKVIQSRRQDNEDRELRKKLRAGAKKWLES
jgi:hypothetical protein